MCDQGPPLEAAKDWADAAEPVRRAFFSQRLRLSYVDWGNADAPLLVLVHGGRDHSRNWDWVARSLREDWHVVCPDLRGHGDSAWSPDGNYAMPSFVADLAELIKQLGAQTVSIVAHSLGSAISLRYAGVFPDRVRRLAAIEGLGTSPQDLEPTTSVAERWRKWIDDRWASEGRISKRYATVDDACARMQEQHPHLTAEQALHLTVHSVRKTKEGAFEWKFDNLLRSVPPVGITTAELHSLWSNIDCPVWLVHGADSWVAHPDVGGRSAHFRQAAVTSYEGAGHWVHHNRLDGFLPDLKAFL